jgi:hypothetical protein
MTVVLMFEIAMTCIVVGLAGWGILCIVNPVTEHNSVADRACEYAAIASAVALVCGVVLMAAVAIWRVWQ